MKKLPMTDLQYRVSAAAKLRYQKMREESPPLMATEIELGEHTHPDFPLVQREVFGRLYHRHTKPVAMEAETPIERLAKWFHEKLDEVPAWSSLRETCHMDSLCAANATQTLLNHLALECGLPEISDIEDEDAADEALEQWLDSMTSDEAQAEIRGELDRACLKASKEAREVQEAVSLLLPGTSSQQLSDADPATAMKLGQLMQSNPALRDILAALGPLRQAMTAQARKKPMDGKVNPVSVEPTDQLRDLLGAEVAKLAMADTEDHTLLRLTQRQTLGIKRRDSTPLDQGPFVILADCSQSMTTPAWQGISRIDLAKALIIASLLQAKEQGREVKLIWFDGAAWQQQVDLSTPASTLDTIQRIALQSAVGGTSLSAPFLKLREVQPDQERADVLLISDGNATVFKDEVEAGLGSMALHYLLIGPERESNPILRSMAKAFFNVAELDPTSKSLASFAMTASRGA